jgi:hypothetical protein
MVPTEGLEPPHLAAHGPEPCASTNSATWALCCFLLYFFTTARRCRRIPLRYQALPFCARPTFVCLSPGCDRLASIFVSGWAVFEESESIADQLQMSKGYESIPYRSCPAALPGPAATSGPAARFGRQVRRIPASSVTLRVKTCQSNHCADSRPTHWLNKIKKTI